MKKIAPFILVSNLFLFIYQVSAQDINIATYNLRNDNTSDIGNMWKDRYTYIAKLILYHDFDLFATQEALPHQLADLQVLLPNYSWYGEGRDGNGKGEHAAIFYKKSKYTLLDKGDFWLSETPEIPSKSWDAPCCNRICSWVKLKDNASQKTIYIFNAHYDYEKDYARYQSSLLVLSRIRKIAGENPVVFMGDLNGESETSWCKVVNESGILRDSFFDVDKPYTNNASYNAWGAFDTLGEEDQRIIQDKLIIDHIFISKHFIVNKWGLLTDTYNMGKFPSDHFPVLISATLK